MLKILAMHFKAGITLKKINFIALVQLWTEVYVCSISLHSCPAVLRRRPEGSVSSLWNLINNMIWKDKCQFSLPPPA